MFCRCCLPFCPFYFGHCVVCSSSIYGFWLSPLGIFKLFLHYDLFSNVFITVKCRNVCFESCSFIIPDGLLIIEDSWHIYIWRFEYEILPLWQTRTFFKEDHAYWITISRWRSSNHRFENSIQTIISSYFTVCL